MMSISHEYMNGHDDRHCRVKVQRVLKSKMPIWQRHSVSVEGPGRCTTTITTCLRIIDYLCMRL